jgi:hypothetical protein
MNDEERRKDWKGRSHSFIVEDLELTFTSR